MSISQNMEMIKKNKKIEICKNEWKVMMISITNKMYKPYNNIVVMILKIMMIFYF